MPPSLITTAAFAIMNQFQYQFNISASVYPVQFILCQALHMWQFAAFVNFIGLHHGILQHHEYFWSSVICIPSLYTDPVPSHLPITLLL